MSNFMEKIETVQNVPCYEKDGVAYLSLEAVARGLGFTRIAESGNTVIRWERVEGYLKDLGVPTCGHDDFIPENIFYRLAMKAKNETAEKFQALIADEVIPTIRKTGAYMTPETVEKILNDPDTIISLATQIKELRSTNAKMLPKADYYDKLVDRESLTSITNAAKLIGIKPRSFSSYLVLKNFLFLDKKGNLMPYQRFVDAGLFVIKQFVRGDYTGVQTLLTIQGLDKFRKDIA